MGYAFRPRFLMAFIAIGAKIEAIVRIKNSQQIGRDAKNPSKLALFFI